MRLDIKPLSVNEAWRGRRFKTDKYKKYERDILSILPSMKVPEGKLAVAIEFGLSSKNADVDNPVKCFVDCLQKKYGFNDRNIYMMVIQKEDVKKGAEYIEFEIKSISPQ